MGKRSNYRNGDEITLSCGCDGCSPSMINGVLCHETGCPEAWRDYPGERSAFGGRSHHGHGRHHRSVDWEFDDDAEDA